MSTFVNKIMLTILSVTVFYHTGYGQQNAQEPYRPQVHFSPAEKWMNDPNGMIFYKGVYHLFYQYYPDNTVWGPMHWGHAQSKDLMHWEHLPVALYPDSLGYIFSGSIVLDVNNTSGLGKNGIPPFVAIFTHHDPKGEKAGTDNFQNQSIAYSLDEGKTWVKYSNNPVLKNPGIKDFRDPKVMWYEEGKKWIMTLATKDRITFYSSPDLKEWVKESEFGEKLGAHSGVWECPDLFPLYDNGKQIWVLLVSINPGGPNGGSATQYFTGAFDGNKFVPFDNDTRWIDYGPDNYAGVTWYNTGKRRLFLGWMSNWTYAGNVPTEKWRGMSTFPRELHLTEVGNKYFLASVPVKEMSAITAKAIKFDKLPPVNSNKKEISGAFKLELTAEKVEDLSVIFSNSRGEEVVIGYDKATNNYYVDRSKSGKIAFSPDFGRRSTSPRIAVDNKMNMTFVFDNSSVELFADNGLSVMTALVFPNEAYKYLEVKAKNNTIIKKISCSLLRGH